MTQLPPGASIMPNRSSATASHMRSMFDTLPPISLEDTNQKARMLSRIDNKYLLNLEQFREFTVSLENDYAVLEISENRQFRYLSCYYDHHFGCYLEHHQGRRQRLKVRTREYVDGGGIKFFEIKLKGRRGLTEKHRCETENLLTPRVEGEKYELVCDLYRKQYQKDMPYDLTPALLVGYNRSTLVARTGSERVTVDFKLNFSKISTPHAPITLGENFIVIETKSASGKGTADRVLKTMGIRPASKLSKYCLGLGLTGSVPKSNNFQTSIRRARRNIVTQQLNQPVETEVTDTGARINEKA